MMPSFTAEEITAEAERLRQALPAVSSGSELLVSMAMMSLTITSLVSDLKRAHRVVEAARVAPDDLTIVALADFDAAVKP